MIMGSFANSKGVMWFATVMGCILFLINAVGLLPESCNPFPSSFDIPITVGPWYGYLIIAIVFIGYVTLLLLVICEPVQNLAPLSKEELEE